jgi:hypothetical protein
VHVTGGQDGCIYECGHSLAAALLPAVLIIFLFIHSS